MKISHFFLLFAAFFVAACSDDDNPVPDNVLRLDGENVSGPVLVTGEHELAVHFNTNIMADFAGRQLTEIEFFVGETLPANCRVRVYNGGTSAPGTQIYEFDVTNGLQTLRWNKHILATPIDLNGGDLWLSVFVMLNSEQRPIGCDAGPRKDGGDWLFSSTDGQWRTFQARTNESVNWNIRGTVE